MLFLMDIYEFVYHVCKKEKKKIETFVVFLRLEYHFGRGCIGMKLEVCRCIAVKVD